MITFLKEKEKLLQKKKKKTEYRCLSAWKHQQWRVVVVRVAAGGTIIMSQQYNMKKSQWKTCCSWCLLHYKVKWHTGVNKTLLIFESSAITTLVTEMLCSHKFLILIYLFVVLCVILPWRLNALFGFRLVFDVSGKTEIWWRRWKPEDLPQGLLLSHLVTLMYFGK